MAGITEFLEEARRRRVFRTAGIYAVAAWLAIQVGSEAFPALDIPARAIRYVWLAAIIGLPIALVFGWYFDVTAQGIVRTVPADARAGADLGLRRADYLLLAALGLVAVVIVVQLGGRIANPVHEAPATAEADPRSIGVLPLDNLSGDPAQRYFVDGMHDALISGLSRVAGLRVTSKTSTRAYAETTRTLPEICAELGIAKVIEGSVSRSGDDVRVGLQLIDCRTDEHLWAETYDRRLSDVLMLQGEITRAVARAVEVTLTQDESALLAGTGPVDPAAYEAYLQGMFHLELFTPQDMELAKEYFARALRIDGDSALAHWGLGRTCRFELQFGHGRPREREPECRAHLLAALEANPNLPQVHLGLALGYWLYDYDWDAAEATFIRALELNPNYAEAHLFYAHLLGSLGRVGESDAQIGQAVALDPLNVFVLGLEAAQQQVTGRLDLAVATLGELHRKVPGFGFGHEVLWFSNFGLGNLDAALAAARATYSTTIGVATAAAAIDRGYADGGYAGAMRALGAELESVARAQYVPGVFVAVPFAMAGDADKAFEWLDTAFDEHDPMMPYVNTIPALAPVANDPRYRQVLERMKLPRAPAIGRHDR